MMNIKLLLLFLIVLISFIATADVIYKLGQPPYTNSDGIYDIGFELIQNKTHNANMYRIKNIIYSLYLFIFLIAISGNSVAMYEYVVTCAIILLLKNILIMSTVLPDASKKCMKFEMKNISEGSCYDYIISSHTVLFFVSILILLNHNIVGPLGIIGSTSIFLLILYYIIALRQHYSMDIVNGIMYSIFVYHFVATQK